MSVPKSLDNLKLAPFLHSAKARLALLQRQPQRRQRELQQHQAWVLQCTEAGISLLIGFARAGWLLTAAAAVCSSHYLRPYKYELCSQNTVSCQHFWALLSHQPSQAHMTAELSCLFRFYPLLWLLGLMLVLAWTQLGPSRGAPVVQLPTSKADIQPGSVLPHTYGGVEHFAMPARLNKSEPTIGNGTISGTLHLFLKAARWPDGHLRMKGT